MLLAGYCIAQTIRPRRERMLGFVSKVNPAMGRPGSPEGLPRNCCGTLREPQIGMKARCSRIKREVGQPFSLKRSNGHEDFKLHSTVCGFGLSPGLCSGVRAG